MRTFVIALTLAAMSFAAPARAEQFSEIGDYIVHYNAITTNILSAEVASAYGISRSKSRAMLNIAVLKKTEDGLGEPVEATIDIAARNLNGQRKDIELRLISEQDARYYIGEVNIANMETLRFAMTIAPAGSEQSYDVDFSQQFYID